MTMKLATAARFVTLTAFATLIACSSQPDHFVKTAGGVTVTPAGGPAKKVRLEVVAPKVIRVTAFPGEAMEMPASLMAVKHADGSAAFQVREEQGTVFVSTSDVTAE